MRRLAHVTQRRLIARGIVGSTADTMPPMDPPLPRMEREKRVLYRAQQRGWRELDIIVGKWAEIHVPSLSDDELGQFESLLQQEIPDLYKWLSGQLPVPEEFHENAVLQSLLKFTVEGNVTNK